MIPRLRIDVQTLIFDPRMNGWLESRGIDCHVTKRMCQLYAQITG